MTKIKKLNSIQGGLKIKTIKQDNDVD